MYTLTSILKKIKGVNMKNRKGKGENYMDNLNSLKRIEKKMEKILGNIELKSISAREK